MGFMHQGKSIKCMVFVELATTITTTTLFKRDVVMHLLAHIAPEDSASRRRNCLTRRSYHSKVIIVKI